VENECDDGLLAIQAVTRDPVERRPRGAVKRAGCAIVGVVGIDQKDVRCPVWCNDARRPIKVSISLPRVQSRRETVAAACRCFATWQVTTPSPNNNAD